MPRKTFRAPNTRPVKINRKIEQGNPVKAVVVAGELKVKLFQWTLLRVDIPSLTVHLHRPKR